MTRDDIIKMAREAGFNPVSYMGANLESFERFAELVAAREREACAKVCEGLGVHPALNVFNGGPEWYKHGKDCAAAIRARGSI
jgi:Tat protein secretion system quality control protein TatD with DNase activity